MLLTITATAVNFAPGTAAALDRVYCSNPDVSCDCAEYPSSMECVEFDMGNLVDVTDPYAVNQAYDVQTTYDEETGVYHVHATNTTAVTHVLPTHPNDGHWNDIEELTEYVNAVMGLDSTSETPPPMAIVDVCSTSPLEPVAGRFSGLYARWDTIEDQWANLRTGGFLQDLITGPDGDMTIGEDFGHSFTRTRTCETPSQYKLEGHQCSGTWEEEDVIEYPCSLDEDYSTRVIGSDIKIAWNDNTVDPLIAPGVMVADFADEMDIDGRWYDSSGQQRAQPDNQSPVLGTKGEDVWRVWDPTTGTCGYGYARKRVNNQDYEVSAVTRYGTAPSSCPNAP